MYYEVETLVTMSGKSSVFTYSSEVKLKQGQLVCVPFGRISITGVVKTEVTKPDFAAKPIIKSIGESVVENKYLQFADWFKNYYPVKKDELSAMFLPKFLATNPKSKTPTSKKPSKNLASQPSLHSDQESAVSTILNSTSPVILQGIVGSGKTRVYFEAAKRVLESGKSVLILSPEIPLSAQLAKRAQEFFGKIKVVHYHSALASAKRRDIWLDILNSSEPKVIVGPRSALFLPVISYGLIAVDEFHENAYKQLDGLHYHANDAAGVLAKLHGAHIVYGSATPPLREYYIAKSKKYPIIKLDKLAAGSRESLREITLVDQKDRSLFSQNSYLSNYLIQSIGKALQNEQQIILLHNRRGTARVILCDKCGWSLDCPSCDTHMVYHHDQNKCVCHTCGFKSTLPTACPDCSNREILLKSVGTKALALELEKLFPDARIARFDSDNTKAESLGERISDIEAGSIDILVGTQLLAKGLDLKRLAVVGITGADSGLQLPDFASGERLFQLILQATGRVGRGHSDGVCVIQTYQPNSQLFASLKRGDWSEFYDSELADRQKHAYPPFVFMLKLSCSRKTLSGSEKAATNLANQIKQDYSGLLVIGPSPAFRGRERGEFVQQIIVKSKNRSTLLKLANNLPAGWRADLDPTSLL